MVVYGKIYFGAYTKDQYILHKIILDNYISYYGQPSYIGIFPVYLRMPLIFRDSSRKWVLTMCTTGNLEISGAFLSQLHKILT